TDKGIACNWAALGAVGVVPGCGIVAGLPRVDGELCDRRYAAPFGIAPMGGPSIAFPGADRALAMAGQRARVPYCLSTVAGVSIEEAAELAPDVFWFQLYRFSNDDHKVGFDLVRRADAAGAHVPVLTLDVPVPTARSREVAAGIVYPFRPTLSMALGILSSPAYLNAFARNGFTRFACMKPYVGGSGGVNDVARFMENQSRGAFTWDEVAR